MGRDSGASLPADPGRSAFQGHGAHAEVARPRAGGAVVPELVEALTTAAAGFDEGQGEPQSAEEVCAEERRREPELRTDREGSEEDCRVGASLRVK